MPKNIHPTYDNSTIVEALCEVRFQADDKVSWDIKVTSDLYKKLHTDLPMFEPIQEATMEISPDPENGRVSQRFIQGEPRIRYTNESGTRQVNISQSRYSYHLLKKYTKWLDLEEGMLKNWKKVSQIFDPEKIERLGLRYVNKIPRSGDYPNLKDWIKENDFLPKKLINSKDGFVFRAETHFSKTDYAIITLVDHVEGDQKYIMFDIDRVHLSDMATTESVIKEKITVMHEDIWDIFSTAMTPKLESYLNKGDCNAD